MGNTKEEILEILNRTKTKVEINDKQISNEKLAEFFAGENPDSYQKLINFLMNSVDLKPE